MEMMVSGKKFIHGQEEREQSIKPGSVSFDEISSAAKKNRAFSALFLK